MNGAIECSKAGKGHKESETCETTGAILSRGNGEMKVDLCDSTSNKDQTACIMTSNFKFSKSPDLEDIRQLQADFVRERNWDQYHQPRNLLLALMGEVGEVAELFQWKSDDEVKEGLTGWPEEDKNHLAQELSDVLIYLIRLAEKCQIDLPSAVLSKIALNKQKYPTNKVWGSRKKYTEYH